MFRILGVLATRYRVGVVLFWIAAAVILNLIAPPLDEVSTTDQKDFLPSDVPFVHAQALYEETFPEFFGPSSTVLLIDAGAGRSIYADDVWHYMEQLEAWLNSEDAPENIAQVVSPTTDPEFAAALISPDEQVALISVALTTPTDAIATVDAVEAIDQWLEENTPATFDVYQTGEAALNAQAEESTFTTMDRTIVITFVLVIVALLVIYRSPVSPLIPLFSVTMAFLVTIGLLANLAERDVLVVVAQVNAVLVVVMYGAGTDYCLFLISRFREEMADDIGVQKATRRTLHLVGEAILASAGTIIVGFFSMTFAEMGMFRSAGPMLALAMFISLLAGLTLTPALLALLGNRAFWPGKASHRSPGRFYAMTSKWVSTYPLTVVVVIVLLMLPFSVSGLSRELNFDFVSELPENIPSVEGYHLLGEHMGAGNLFPLTLVVSDRSADAAPREIVELTEALTALPGVDDVRGLHTPLGVHHTEITNLLRVDGQLRMLLAMDDGDGGGTLTDAGAVIGGIQRYLDAVVLRFPEVADDPNLTTIREITAGGLVALALRQDDLMAAVEGLAARFETMDDAYLLPPTGEGDLFADLAPLVESYMTNDGTAYRLEVVLDEPLTNIKEQMTPIRELVAQYGGEDQAGVVGFSAVMADMVDTLARDTVRVYGFVLAGVFIMLTMLLRSLVAPLYLLGTVVLSYTTTLGITGLFFSVVFDVHEFSWLLPVFMFVFLVALGIDYSIYLFSRIREEVGHHGTREGVHVAVAATGAIITSAAVILAGTFAGMMAGELLFLSQLGFAVSVGVLIDAFVVRTILDPALATLFGQWTWWPGGVPHAPLVDDDDAPQTVIVGSATHS